MIRRAAVVLLPALLLAAPVPAAVIQTSLPQLLPPPVSVAPPALAPLPPPVNPGYAAAPPSGLSPLLTEPGPLYRLPQPAAPAYPPPRLPGPIDQQKAQAYRNALRSQQYLGGSVDRPRSRDIQRQLDAPDPQ